jgi:hypothetical protein
MANKKISELDAATGPAGTDVVPINEGGTTKRATLTQIGAVLVTAVTVAAAGAVMTSRSIVSGNGLTGGGDLTADRTLAVGAHGDGSIVVAADTVQVGVLATDAQHGTRSGGTLHAAATQSSAGFMSAREMDMALRQQQGYRYSMDFESSVTGTPWTSSVSGSGSANSVDTTDYASHIGVLSSETGTTTSGRAAIALRLGSLVTLGNGDLQFSWVSSIPTLSTVAEEFIVVDGLGNLVTGEPTDGVYFLYDRLNRGTTWQLVTAEDGARTYTDTAVVVTAGAWYRMRAVVNAAGTSVQGFIGVNGADPTLVATDSGANIPITSDPLGPLAAIVKSAGTTTRQVLSDFFVLDITFTASR